jgi:CRP/FNR family transcriptional regulator, cyclic AMP receptor protein
MNKTESISHSPLGAELSEAECRILAEQTHVRALADGDILVHEGESRRTLFILAEGRLDVTRVTGDDEISLYQMQRGECAGTRAFVDGSPRAAGLRAVGHSTVLTLEPDAFEALLETHPQVVFKVMRALFRITRTNLMRMNQESAQLRNYVTRSQGRY